MMTGPSHKPGSASGDESGCFSGSDMACPTASVPNNCGVNAGLLLSRPIGLMDVGSQPLPGAIEDNYQNPFLASTTPPPQPRA